VFKTADRSVSTTQCVYSQDIVGSNTDRNLNERRRFPVLCCTVGWGSCGGPTPHPANLTQPLKDS